MRNTKVRCIVMALMLLVSSRISVGQSANANEELLDTPIQNLRLKEANVSSALSKLAGCYGIPIGFEFALTDKQSFYQRIELDMPASKLKDVLNAIVKQDGRYEWKVIDGVINVFPKTDRDDVLTGLLKMQVKQFAISKGTSLYRIRYGIVELPEIKSSLEQKKIIADIEGFIGSDFRPAGREFSLQVSNVRLRELMNQIIKESEVKYWVVNRTGEDNKYLILNF